MRTALLLAGALAALAILAPVSWAAPPNDSFSAAETLLAGLPASGSGPTLGATKEAGEPDHAGNPGGRSVWYSWTPSVGGRVGISPGTGCFSGIDLLVAVYTGSAVDALTTVASNDGLPPPSCFGEGPQIEFDAVAGATYRIAIDGREGAEGSFSFSINGSPGNDGFADAAPIAGVPPPQVSGTTRFAGAQAGEPAHSGEPASHSVWYSWTPVATGPVALSTCSSFFSLDTLLAVYTGAAVDSLTPVASNDDAPATEGFPGCAPANSEVRFEAVAGTTYRIAVDSTGGTVGRFSLRLRGRPGNDDFADAQALPNDPTFPIGASQETTDMATEQTGEPDHAGAAGGRSVWYSWTPDSSGRVVVSTCTHESREDPDTLLAVYTGSAVDSLTQIAANDDGPGFNCRDSDSEVSFAAASGTTYRIAVDAKGESTGRFDLQVQGPPANDDFGGAQAVGASPPASAIGSTLGASEQAGEPDHAGEPGGHSVWFSWTPVVGDTVVVTACPYTERTVTQLAVYTGSAVSSLTPVAADAAGGSSCRPSAGEVEFSAVAGTTYRIAVDGEAQTLGMFSLEIRGRPGNDDFAAPEVLSPNPMSAGGTNRLATEQAGEPDHAGNPGGHSLWYSWTPSSSGPVDITACGHTREIDTLLAVYTGSSLDGLTPVASNDDAPGPSANELCEFSRGNSEVEFDAVAGATYRIAIDGKGGGVGRFGLAFERAPANDDFAAAQQLGVDLPAYGGAVTKLATKQAGEPDHTGDPGGHSVWYSWTPADDGPVGVSTCVNEGDLDPVLAVYTGSAVGSLTPVGSADEPAGWCPGAGSEAQFDAVAGTTYRIAVDGRGGSAGRFQLFLEGVAPNDDFGKALSLGGGLPARFFFYSNRFATKQSGEPNHASNAGGASLWFKWTAPVSTEVSVDTCGSGFDTLLAVYTGSTLNALAPVASDDDATGKCSPKSKLSFAAVANTTYRIAIDGKNGAEGAIRLTIDARPTNDEFEAAEKTPSSLGWYWPGTTRLATKQIGEPDHDGDPGGHSVWYSWTPTKSAPVELDSCATDVDPVVAIYSGATVGSLTPIPTSDAGTGHCDEGVSTGFDAIAGTTYRIAVDGAGGDEGSFELHLRPAIEHPRSLSVSSTGAGSVVANAVDCTSFCSYDFEVGDSVGLSAQPAPGSSFVGWTGGGCSGVGSCEIVLNADATVVANFTSAAGGGGEDGRGGAVAPPPSAAPESSATPKPLRCKPGFKKTRVRGKARCVRKKRHHRKRGHSAR